VRLSNPQVAGHLAIAGASLQLHDLVDLPQALCTDRLAVAINPLSVLSCNRPPISLAKPAIHFSPNIGAEPALGHVNQIGTGVGVLQLRHPDFWTDACHLTRPLTHPW
jgi:hypothetical protein